MEYKFKVNVYSDSSCTQKLKDASGSEYAEKILIAKMERGENEWIWTAQTDPYVFLKPYVPEGSTDTGYPYFKIEEDDTWCPWHKTNSCGDNCEYKTATKFDEAKTRDALNGKVDNLNVTTNTVTGRFTKEAVESGIFENTIINNNGGIVNPVTGNLKINKKITSEVLRNNTFDFIAKVSGTFAFDANGNGAFEDDEWHKNAVIQLTGNNSAGNNIIKDFKVLKETRKNGENEEEFNIMEDENSYDKESLVSITIPEGATLNQSYSLTSNKFAWYGEAPSYSVEEKMDNATITVEEDIKNADGTISTPAGTVMEIKSTGVPQKGNLAETTYDASNRVYNTVEVTAVNSADGENSEPKAGYIKIIKKLKLEEIEGLARNISS